MAAESDEILAKRLQAEFDAEDAFYQQCLMMNSQIVASASRTHDISDSDSDATIEPPDYSGSLDGSQDLFDSGTGPSSFTTSSGSPSSKKKRLNVVSSQNMPANSRSNSQLQKGRKTHEMSDSDSDSAHCSRPSEPVVKLKPKDKSKPSSGGSFSNIPPKRLSSKLTGGAASYHDDKCSSASSDCIPRSELSNPISRSSSVAKKGLNKDDERLGARPANKYGDRSYRTNPNHFQEFTHEGDKNGKRKNPPLPSDDADGTQKKSRTDEDRGVSQGPSREQQHQVDDFDKTVADVYSEFQPLSLFLTKVRGIHDRFNNTGAVSLKDILSPLMGNLQASCQFNYMTDISWLVSQYPKQFRDKPLLLVHGEQGRDETELKKDGALFPHISFCRAKLEMMFGTHHTKMMFLLYDCGMRVVIHTANLIHDDWHQKTQGVWISPLFPKLPDAGGASSGQMVPGDSPTKFKRDLLAYLAAYRAAPLTQWERHIQQHDMSSACVYIIGSVPGRHTGNEKNAWGHLKLRKVLQENGPEKTDAGTWQVFGQFSSIGSLGASPDQWLCNEWLTSLSQCKGAAATPLHHSKLKLVYPSKENVRLCLEGYGGGGCLPYSIKTAQKQIYLNNFVRKWGSEGRGRTEAIPHIKTYTRVSPDYKQAAWFMVTSANLSKAAWGALEKQKTQLMIRSYEIGVLFLPEHFGVHGSFPAAKTAAEVCNSKEVMLPFPYDLPPPEYQKGDRIWMWDVPCVDLPDTHGKKYCPRL